MWFQHKFYKYATAVLLLLLIVFMLDKIDYFFVPFLKVAGTLLAPVLITGLLYYIFRPAVNVLTRFKLPKTLAVIITFVLTVVIIALLSTYIGTIIADQFKQLTLDLPEMFGTARQKITDIINHQWFKSLSINDIQDRIADYLKQITGSLSKVALGIFSTVTNIGTVLVVVPFILFYLLKDDCKLSDYIHSIIPHKHKENIQRILGDMDKALSLYITGQALVAVTIGILMFTGYLIIGIKYTVVLAFFAMITSIIPFFGPLLGILPALLVAITIDMWMVLKVLIVMTAVQQIDNNLISPQIMGRRMHIHPAVILLLLMIGVSVFGFIGLLIIIPLYAVVRVTASNLYNMYGTKD